MTRFLDHEARLYLAAHPFAYPLLRLLARLGPVVRVPRLGVVVNDAAVARRVLMDPAFRKDGPGSPGDLWTPVLGPSVLLNMEGEAHAALRAKLAPLFVPATVRALVADVLAGPLDELEGRLARGETVDLVDTMRLMAGAVICKVIGLGEVSEERARELFADGERVVSMVSLRTRSLSARQVKVAREVLDRIGDIASAAYRDGDPGTVMGRMSELGLSEAEARGAAGAFFLTGTETVATFVPRLVALLHDHGAFGSGPGSGVEREEEPGERPGGGSGRWAGGEPGGPARGEPGDQAGGEPGDPAGGEPGDRAGGEPGDRAGGEAGDEARGRAGEGRGDRPGEGPRDAPGGRAGGEAGLVVDLDRAIEEAMRVTTPTPVMLRSVSRVARVGNVDVRPGDRVMIVTHNCARAAGGFDPSRRHPPELRRLWFGAGAHFCIGYPLAVEEIKAVASVVLRTKVTVVRRRAARGVLLPTYAELLVRRVEPDGIC
ncbi:cytochrome P450 [Nonomuraea soli]|uniref:Cytochrome P450 n=1 Tax=Nonomuraea soli TaxID=1032476 RepID=A0A7W0HQL5_9ACTN|nr:cytochrome P450 [Nonomuraea soli]MBA2891937.1 cytochrome P450 [Nonomuraea soli]